MRLISGLPNGEYPVYALEQRHGLETGTLSADILGEVEKVRRCDLLLQTFHIYWFSMPAILKGSIDRVFVSGAFYGGRRIYDRGAMVGKKALVCATLGGRQSMVCDGGIHGDLATMLRPLLQGTLGYVGFDVLEPFFAYHVPYIQHKERIEILDAWRTSLAALEHRPAMQMPSLADFDETLSRRLSSEGWAWGTRRPFKFRLLETTLNTVSIDADNQERGATRLRPTPARECCARVAGFVANSIDPGIPAASQRARSPVHALATCSLQSVTALPPRPHSRGTCRPGCSRCDSQASMERSTAAIDFPPASTNARRPSRKVRSSDGLESVVSHLRAGQSR
jgi:NAD(P)H dehydrogenase (quinone)